MNTADQSGADERAFLDNEGVAMIVNSQHYTAENIHALIQFHKSVEAGDADMLDIVRNQDARTQSGILWRVLSALSSECPIAATPQPFPAPAVQAPIAWWNGLRKFDYQDGTEPAFSGAEDTNHDIPLYSWPNPCNAAPIVATVPSEPLRPDILEKLTYHKYERDDMSLDDCLEYLANGWKKIAGRPERALIMQITELLASQPCAAPSTAAEQASDVRNDALEEAAKRCDDKFQLRMSGGFPREGSTARVLAEEIRALKSAPAAKGNAPAEVKS